MTPKLRLGLMVGAIVALGAAAVAGWVRQPAAASASYGTNPEPIAAPVAANPPASSAGGYDEYGQPRNNPITYNSQPAEPNSQPAEPQPPNTQPAGYYAAGAATSNGCQYPTAVLPAYASPHYVRTIHAQVETPGYSFYAEGYGNAPRYREERREYVVHGRHHHRFGEHNAARERRYGVGKGHPGDELRRRRPQCAAG